MRRLIVAHLSLAFALCACGISQQPSNLRDIGIVDTFEPIATVIYSEDDVVLLKICRPAVAPPLTRRCTSIGDQSQTMELQTYIDRLPYETGSYERSERGLSIASKALADAVQALKEGVETARPVVKYLTSIQKNLVKVLAIKENLGAEQRDLTYYEYETEFVNLVSPFVPRSWTDPENNATYQYVGAFSLLDAPKECNKLGNGWKVVVFGSKSVTGVKNLDLPVVVEDSALRLLNSPLKTHFLTQIGGIPSYAFWMFRAWELDELPKKNQHFLITYGENFKYGQKYGSYVFRARDSNEAFEEYSEAEVTAAVVCIRTP